jgi:U6 snRNA-associated Sm-like protein LSm1
METELTTSQPENEICFREYEKYINKHVVVMLKDNRFYYGVFKSFDQYNSITLNYSVERIFHENSYAEKFQGLLVIRGDTISLIGISKMDFKEYNKMEYSVLLEIINKSILCSSTKFDFKISVIPINLPRNYYECFYSFFVNLPRNYYECFYSFFVTPI